MEHETQQKFKSYLEKKVTTKVVQDNISRLKRLETMLAINLDNLSLDDFDISDISLKLNTLLSQSTSNANYVYITKGGMLTALRHFVRYKFKKDSKKIISRLSPIKIPIN